MTLGEYAQQIAATEGKLLERNIPTIDRKWFWGEVANQITAQRPVMDVQLGGDGFSRARDKVLEQFERITG